ncbi:MAG: DUF3574 domain-containing protein [Chitinophagaceae bacterium]
MPFKLLIICFILSSCTASRMMETNLYFGQSKPDGGMVSEKEWNSFKEMHISKVFKEGSTVVNVTGNWFDPDSHKLITEPTYMVVYFYKKSPAVSKQIDSLRYWYKTMFQQQSVLRVDKKVKASF